MCSIIFNSFYNAFNYNIIYLRYNLKRYNMDLRIKEVLKEKKMTVVSLASSVGMAQPSMSNIVNGKSTPSLETLEKIANALDVDITELFDQPKKSALAITCPHCGKSINIKVE